MPRKSKSTVMVPVQGKMVSIPKASANKVVIVSTSKKSGKKNRNRKRNKISINRSSQLSPLSIYKLCVADPFDNPPVRLGFDTFVPTGIHTAYFRGSLSANLDGSFDIVVLPNLASFIFTNTAGANAAPFWNLASAANFFSINSQIDMSRIVSMGIRIFPQIALTAPPGLLSSGVSPRCSQLDFLAFMSATTNARQNLPYNQFFLGRTGNTECNQVCWRPTDASEFTFQDRTQPSFQAVAGAVITNTSVQSTNFDILDTQGSFIHISGTGLPTSGTTTPVAASIFYEVVFHIETTSTAESIAGDTADDSNPRVCDDVSISSLQSAYRSIANFLPSSSTALEAGAKLFGSSAGQAAIAYAKHRLLTRSSRRLALTAGDSHGFVNIS